MYGDHRVVGKRTMTLTVNVQRTSAMTQPADLVLALNAGSSSLKFQAFAASLPLRSLVRGAVHDLGKRGCALRVEGGDDELLGGPLKPAEAVERVLDRLFGGAFGVDLAAHRVVATAHRVVHGGTFSAPMLVTPEVEAQLRALGNLAPLHNPPAIAVMEAARAALGPVPLFAVFDTAFFRNLPEPARVYAIPARWRERFAIERYGFHGIAHEYLASRAASLGRDAPRRLLTLQLGQGCSVTALANGRPVETSMGFTPLEGLIMGTRPGDLDAGVLLHLARQGTTWEALQHALQHESGLLALSATSDDMRELTRLEAEGHHGARLAVAAFCHRLCKYIGAYAAVLGGVDAIAFGGGIGEHSPSIRARVCERLAWLGLALDEIANERTVGTEARISSAASSIDVYCIPVREEELIAGAALELLRNKEETV
jgi:acetate kinase